MLSVNSSGSNINEKEYDVANNTNKFNDNILRILMNINPTNMKVTQFTSILNDSKEKPLMITNVNPK